MAWSFSSTPSSQSLKKYDIFISFRGEDTRLNFTSHLHDALRRNQIETYVDYRLEKGDEVWPSLEKAIEDSTLFLVIFSENYASSTWCLKELTKILECSENQGHLVMPVFYRVDPSHVRKQSGSYQKAFEEHELKRIDKQQLQKWREALTHAANLSGWDCSFNRNEVELITEMVKYVTQKLDCVYQSEDDLKDLIGIHKRMADVESLFHKCSNDDVRFIGIWAMGGMGKTTLAKALFNKLCIAYEGSCFLTNVREESKKYGIVALKKKLILTLLWDRGSHFDMLDDTISPYAMRRLGRKKIFIVLDDVDDHEQLENLARRHDWFGPGSRILITTRDKQILGKNVDDIYILKPLNSVEAFQLFSLNAFKKDCGDPKVRNLAMDVTSYANGNPLALKVLGSFLYGKKQEEWESQLQKLQKLPHPKINDVLKLSLEGLDYEEKNIFLDIACFFGGYYVENVKNLLDACGYSTIIGLKSLEDKTLLNISKGRIYMHRLIKEMGQQIIRDESLNDPKRRSRLWNSKEISQLLKDSMGSEAIEGITLNVSEVEEMCLSSRALCSMPNLKFLIFHSDFNDRVVSKLKFPYGIDFLPKKLRLLRWVGYPLKSLPATFKPENLVEIGMPNSNLTKFWDGVQNLVNLSKIDVTGSKDLTELPDFSKAIHLSEVNLEGCSKLQSVHPSILSLNSLRRLWLYGCKALTSLTSNTHLKSLSDLNLEECSRLNKFSVTSNNCGFELKLTGTAINDELCSSSGYLSKIDSLFLDRCISLTSLPYKLVDLRNLTLLSANGCNKLAANLRSIFDETRALKYLELTGCSELFEVPDNISLLSSLRELNLSRTNIETLPLSIKHLSSLRDLYLSGCGRLRFLPELPPSILVLYTMNCLSLGSLHLPMTNEGEEGKEVNDDEEGKEVNYDDDEIYKLIPYFTITNCMKMNQQLIKPFFAFTNCMKLDQQSIKLVEVKVLLEINRPIYKSFILEYPGKRVPEWFICRTTQSPLTVDVSSIPQPWDGRFIFCAVISKFPLRGFIECRYFIDKEYVVTTESWFETREYLLLDHIALWYDRYPYEETLLRKIEEKKRDAQSNTYHPLVEIEFYASHVKSTWEGLGVIKEFAVYPTSALKLAMHPHPNPITMGLNCFFHEEAVSRKCKYQSLDEFEEMISSFKALKLNDLPTST